MKLWHSQASPFARKVIILAHEAGIFDQIELVNAATSPLDTNVGLLAHNPLGKIPTLVLDDGQVLFDSRVICEYLDDRHEGEKLIPPSGIERYNSLVTQSIGDGMMDAAVLLRYEQAMRPKEKQWEEWIDGQYGKINSSLDVLETWRGARLPQMHIGSIAVVCALGHLDFRHPSVDWRKNRPVLTQMFATFSKRTSMVESDPEKT